MINWTTIIQSLIPFFFITIALLIAVLVLRKNIRTIKTRWGSADLNGRAGIYPAYVLELLIELLAIINQRNDLQVKRRAIIKRAIRQWRHNVAIYVAEEMSLSGATSEGLSKNPIYRYLMSIFDLIGIELVATIMNHAEKNGFIELDQESEKSAYISQKNREIENVIIEMIQRNYLVSENAIITQSNVLGWLKEREILNEVIWSGMYRQIIDVTLDIKSRLFSYVERITAKGAESGMTESEIDNIRNMFRREIIEKL